jgi:hypothetical protein
MTAADSIAGEGLFQDSPCTSLPILRTHQLASRPRDCKKPIPPRPGFPRWRLCGRPKCCRRCHDLWAWKQAKCLLRSVAVLPPTHFLTLRSVASGRTDEAFSEGIDKFLKALRRRCPDGFEYLMVNEWRKGVRHAHALIRVDEFMPFRALQRAVREAKEMAGLLCSVERVRDVIAVTKYIFKDLADPDEKAELPPAAFPGKIFRPSRGFLTKPFKQLWRDVRKNQPPKLEDGIQLLPRGEGATTSQIGG